MKPVEQRLVETTLPHLPPAVRAIVELQLLTGARPSEVCLMRPCDITLGTDGVWTYRPSRHKTEHQEKERRCPGVRLMLLLPISISIWEPV